MHSHVCTHKALTTQHTPTHTELWCLLLLNLLFLLFKVLSIDWQAAQLMSGPTNEHVGSYQDTETSGTPPGSQ